MLHNPLTKYLKQKSLVQVLKNIINHLIPQSILPTDCLNEPNMPLHRQWAYSLWIQHYKHDKSRKNWEKTNSIHPNALENWFDLQNADGEIEGTKGDFASFPWTKNATTCMYSILI